MSSVKSSRKKNIPEGLRNLNRKKEIQKCLKRDIFALGLEEGCAFKKEKLREAAIEENFRN